MRDNKLITAVDSGCLSMQKLISLGLYEAATCHPLQHHLTQIMCP